MEESSFTASDLAATQMTVFYDEFVEFQAYCSLLCDALAAMAATQMELDEATRRGIEAFSGYLKRRLGELRSRVSQLQQASLSWQTPTAETLDSAE